MDFNRSTGHLAKREEFRRFASAEIIPAAGGFARKNIESLARRGYLGLPIPPEWGGQGD